MGVSNMYSKSTVTAICTLVVFSLPRQGLAEGNSQALLQELRNSDSASTAQRLENQLIKQWSKSGSPAMDLLLRRGRDALARGDAGAALEHFTALSDHAPDFAEGWHGLAQAYVVLGLFGPGLDALERTLALNPSHFDALRGLGVLHEEMGNPTLALEVYQKVLELRPHDSEISGAVARLQGAARGVAL